MRAHRQQVVEREVQPDAEHQQHHADLGELARELDVGDEARRGGPDHDAGEQVADQRRQPQPHGEKPRISASRAAAAIVVIRLTLCGTLLDSVPTAIAPRSAVR